MLAFFFKTIFYFKMTRQCFTVMSMWN